MLQSQGLLSKVKAAREDVLLMSVKSCHADKVSSIVVERFEGRLLRAFLAWPGHQLHTNRLGDKMVVGIHDHRYSLGLSLILGKVRNATYEYSHCGVEVHRWAFGSGVSSGQPKAAYYGTVQLLTESMQYLTEDRGLLLPAWKLHNIDCVGPAAWWVREGQQVKVSTTLLTATESINLDGLYQRFESKDEVVSHVEEFLNVA